VVLYELTTGGARPHDDAPTEFVAMKRTIEAPVAPPSTRRTGYPEDLERIVMRGLERDREKRWWTARELQLELETFARRRQLAMSPVTLARLMEELFPDELHAWHDAQSRGTPLADHVTKSHTLSIDEPAGDKTTDPWAGAPADASTSLPRRDPRRALVAVTLAIAIAASFAAVIVARRGSRAIAPPQAAVVAPPAAATQPAAPPPAAPRLTEEAPATPEPKPATKRRVVRAAKKPARTPSAGHWDPETAVLPH
jgi:hypothetical protein